MVGLEHRNASVGSFARLALKWWKAGQGFAPASWPIFLFPVFQRENMPVGGRISRHSYWHSTPLWCSNGVPPPREAPRLLIGLAANECSGCPLYLGMIVFAYRHHRHALHEQGIGADEPATRSRPAADSTSIHIRCANCTRSHTFGRVLWLRTWVKDASSSH